MITLAKGSEEIMMRGGIVRMDVEQLLRILGLKGQVLEARIGRTRSRSGHELAIMFTGDDRLPELPDNEPLPDVDVVMSGHIDVLSIETKPREQWGGW